jgi:hypothetical protein
MKVHLAYYDGDKFAGRSQAFIEFNGTLAEFEEKGFGPQLEYLHMQNGYLCDIIKGFEEAFGRDGVAQRGFCNY